MRRNVNCFYPGGKSIRDRELWQEGGEGKGGTHVVRETRENVGCNYVDVCRCDMYVVFCICHFSRMFLTRKEKQKLFIQSYVINPILWSELYLLDEGERSVIDFWKSEFNNFWKCMSRNRMVILKFNDKEIKKEKKKCLITDKGILRWIRIKF